MRTAFIDELIIAARENERIFLVVGDLGFSVIEPFAKEFPDRYLNAGVAEQNMTGVAAGLASEGYHVFTYSIANFPTFRCAEQIRNDVCYHALPVTVVSVGGGVSYGNLGYSHHAVQDYALMRSFPNMLIASPGDPLETRACVRYLSKKPQPSYLRLGKNGESCQYEHIPDMNPGLPIWPKGHKNRPNLILSTGGALNKVVEAQEQEPLLKEYIVGSMPLWGMSSANIMKEQLYRYENIITVEEHLKAGGFGSYVLETLNGPRCPQLSQCALNETVCGMVGKQQYLWQECGLTTKRIASLAQAFV